MKNLILSFIFLFSVMPSISAQWKWFNPMDAEFPVVQNQGFTKEIGKSFYRLPERAKGVVADAVWELSRNSAGLAIHFYSNAADIKIRYQVAGGLSMPHMPATGVSGMDLYQIDSDGNLNLCFGGYPSGDTIVYSYNKLIKNKYHNMGYEYRVYLPLYNTVKWMEVGIPENSNLTFIPVSQEKPIVVYGTSIAQGACASRPAMAWTNIIQRNLDYPVINFGFSGWGILEKGMLDLINEIDSRLYILDCLPNLTYISEDEVYQRLVTTIKLLRSKHSTPILLIEHSGYSNAETELEVLESYDHTNSASQKAFKDLQEEGIADLYYLSKKDFNYFPDSRVDYVHFSDLGMQRHADEITAKAREVLHIPTGNLTTTQPITQRREPGSYEWRNRYNQVLDVIRQNPPKAVIIGNSITHYWGGQPECPYKNGPKSWEKTMQAAGFLNLGCGWDRIENALWRIYHGEIDGYSAEKVVVMLGTNNLGYNTDEEIVEGLRFLLNEIRFRQPEAQITMMGIFPRRDQEERIKNINITIKNMAEKGGFEYRDISKRLLLKNGKIDESLFKDGLHPNEKGYSRIAKQIAE